jgi:hypothetical protein
MRLQFDQGKCRLRVIRGYHVVTKRFDFSHTKEPDKVFRAEDTVITISWHPGRRNMVQLCRYVKKYISVVCRLSQSRIAVALLEKRHCKLKVRPVGDCKVIFP